MPPHASPTQGPAEDLTAPRQTGANPRAAYFPALDGLRAVAVLLVFLAHYASLHIGWMGVNIFFVLSGFLITGILFDSQNKTHRFRNFYVRRTLRIFPLFYAVWFAFALLTPVLRIAWRPINLLWPAYLGNWIPLVTVLHPMTGAPFHIVAFPLHSPSDHPLVLFTGHFWSLCIEEQFYFLWPLAVFLLRDRRLLMRVCVFVVALSPLLRMAAMHFLPAAYTDTGVLHNCTFLRLDEFLLGGLGALTMRGPHAARLQAAAKYLLLAGASAIALSFAAGQLIFHRTTDIIIAMRWILSAGITFVDVAALGMILLCLGQNWFSRLMRLAPLRALGKISYGFYVFHDIPHQIYVFSERKLGLHEHSLGLIVPFAGTLALSILSYKLLEEPFLRLKVRFEGHSTASQAHPSSAAISPGV